MLSVVSCACARLLIADVEEELYLPVQKVEPVPDEGMVDRMAVMYPYLVRYSVFYNRVILWFKLSMTLGLLRNQRCVALALHVCPLIWFELINSCGYASGSRSCWCR